MRKIEIHVSPDILEFYEKNPWLYEGLIESLKDQFEDDIEHKLIHFVGEYVTIDIYEINE